MCLLFAEVHKLHVHLCFDMHRVRVMTGIAEHFFALTELDPAMAVLTHFYSFAKLFVLIPYMDFVFDPFMTGLRLSCTIQLIPVIVCIKTMNISRRIGSTYYASTHVRNETSTHLRNIAYCGVIVFPVSYRAEFAPKTDGILSFKS